MVYLYIYKLCICKIYRYRNILDNASVTVVTVV